MKWKEIRRRAGALLLSVAIFVGSVPIGGYAAEEQVLEELQEISDEASDEEIITIPEEGEAVSYTHLDVYKRQTQRTSYCVHSQYGSGV